MSLPAYAARFSLLRALGRTSPDALASRYANSLVASVRSSGHEPVVVAEAVRRVLSPDLVPLLLAGLPEHPGYEFLVEPGGLAWQATLARAVKNLVRHLAMTESHGAVVGALSLAGHVAAAGAKECPRMPETNLRTFYVPHDPSGK
jgi:hypothetical protein